MVNELPRVRIFTWTSMTPLFVEELRAKRLGFCESVIAIRPEDQLSKRIVTVDAEGEEKRKKKATSCKWRTVFC